MSDVQIYGADASDGSQQQQNVIVANFLDEQQQQNAAVAKFTDEAIAKIIQAYAENKEREQRQFDVHGYMIVVATLIAFITYTAASGQTTPTADPPVPQSGWTNSLGVSFFFSCNTLSFASSLCITVMLGSNRLTELGKRYLFILVMDVISLIGAFTAGCSTNASRSIYAFLLMALCAAGCWQPPR